MQPKGHLMVPQNRDGRAFDIIRPMNKMAAIDLGSNTIRILVAEKNGKGFDPVYSAQTITRLGERLHETGYLATDAIDRTATGVSNLVEGAKKATGNFRLTIFGAHAARSASNINLLDEKLQKAVGVGITLISWEDEAKYALKGVRMVIGEQVKRFVLFDIGGGSTEYILGDENGATRSYGANLGVVRLSETYLTKNPVDEKEYNHMNEEVTATVNKAFDELGADNVETIVGTAGTVTSLAAIAQNIREYDPEKINNYRLTKDKIGEIRSSLFAMTIEERSKIPALQHGREDLIVPGVAIIEATLARAGVDSILVTDSGLREGLMASLFEKENNREA